MAHCLKPLPNTCGAAIVRACQVVTVYVVNYSVTNELCVIIYITLPIHLY